MKVLAGPSGLYYNFFDSGSKGFNGIESLELLSWFAQRNNNATLADKSKFSEAINNGSTDGQHVSKMNGAALTWIIKNKATHQNRLPVSWKGDGPNPVAIIGRETNDSNGFYLGTKGGNAGQNHGNMDAGSFVFELNGVRWSVDIRHRWM